MAAMTTRTMATAAVIIAMAPRSSFLRVLNLHAPASVSSSRARTVRVTMPPFGTAGTR